MSADQSVQAELDPKAREFYCHVLAVLTEARMPFLVGGAYAFERYTGIARHTKDFDLFVRQQDCEQTLQTLAAAGYQTELTFPHWLAKAYCDDHFIDVIFHSGNGIAIVDDEWFTHAVDETVFDMPVKLCPVEEIIWSKAFILERERCDMADVAHLLHARAARLDWQRMLRRMGPHWRVLLGHLIFFGFIYPSERAQIPGWVMEDLLGRLRDELNSQPPTRKICQGTLLSRAQYLTDIEQWGYQDARLEPRGNMTADEIAHWTAAIEQEE